MKKVSFLLILVSVLIIFSSCTNTESPEKNLSCAITIDCSNAISSKNLPEEKLDLLPEDGYILKDHSAYFSEGENAFELLIRELRKEKIHFEFSGASNLESQYIEGISNLYQFDCGEFSGWCYYINAEMPSVGLNQYILHDNDVLSLVYFDDFSKISEN